MGRLRRIGDDEIFVLWSQTLIGRDPQCSLALRPSYVSALHARIFWDATAYCWVAEALDSTSGTHYRRPPGAFTMMRPGSRARKTLSRGDELLFGEQFETWVLDDDMSPFPEAHVSNTSRRVPADGGVLRLPSPHDALVCVYHDQDQGTYMLEDIATSPEDSPLPLDRDVLRVAEQEFRIYFDAAQPTSRPVRGDLTRGHLVYEARGAAHRLTYCEGNVRLDLGAYSCFAVVGKLLEAREHDLSDGSSAPDAGWRPREALHIKGHREAATQEMWRCQQQLRTAGMSHVDALFDKRQGQGFVRLGVDVRRPP